MVHYVENIIKKSINLTHCLWSNQSQKQAQSLSMIFPSESLGNIRRILGVEKAISDELRIFNIVTGFFDFLASRCSETILGCIENLQNRRHLDHFRSNRSGRIPVGFLCVRIGWLFNTIGHFTAEHFDLPQLWEVEIPFFSKLPIVIANEFIWSSNSLTTCESIAGSTTAELIWPAGFGDGAVFFAATTAGGFGRVVTGALEPFEARWPTGRLFVEATGATTRRTAGATGPLEVFLAIRVFPAAGKAAGSAS